MDKKAIPHTDKGKWFTDQFHTTFIQCKTERLIDCLIDIFKGDRHRAYTTCEALHQVTFEEYVNNELYKV